MTAFNVKVELDITEDDIKKSVGLAQYILDNQVAKDSNYYIPKDTGMLEGSVQRVSAFGEGKVAWSTPYARRLYYGAGYKFSKDANPNAQAMWFEAAKAAHKNEWLGIVKNKLINELLKG